MAGVKLALLSDLHANLRALHACLGHARDAGATAHAFLGDLVGYGAEPQEVMERVAALAAQGAAVVRGNHDEAALRPPPAQRTAEDASAAWTHARLDAGQRAFLGSLPLTARVGGLLLVHASADAPERWRYVDRPALAERCLDAAHRGAQAQQVACGHVHEQCLYYLGRDGRVQAFAPRPGVAVPLAAHRAWLALPGSVGQPRDGDPRAMYALLDVAQQRITFHRVPYDHAGAAAAIRAAGLPEGFAQRLERGR